MSWKKFLLPPIAIYAVIFLFISALIGAKIDQTALWVWIVALAITIIGLVMATNYAKPKTRNEGMTLGLVWLVMFVVLDLILTIPFTGWDYFSDWKSYIPYLLTLVFPSVLASKN